MEFIKTYGGYFKWTMAAQEFEQSLMFLTLACFYMMISCFRINESFEKQNSSGLLTFFKKRLLDPRFSHSYKLLFFLLRYVQFVLLLTLFLKGISNVNNVKNLGYMLFFVVYTAYEEVYRKTSFILILFNSFFIIGQYTFSLTYELVLDN